MDTPDEVVTEMVSWDMATHTNNGYSLPYCRLKRIYCLNDTSDISPRRFRAFFESGTRIVTILTKRFGVEKLKTMAPNWKKYETNYKWKASSLLKRKPSVMHARQGYERPRNDGWRWRICYRISKATNRNHQRQQMSNLLRFLKVNIKVLVG